MFIPKDEHLSNLISILAQAHLASKTLTSPCAAFVFFYDEGVVCILEPGTLLVGVFAPHIAQFCAFGLFQQTHEGIKAYVK
jgi:hypothetical protein